MLLTLSDELKYVLAIILRSNQVARKDVSSMSSDSWKFYGDVRSIVESAGT